MACVTIEAGFQPSISSVEWLLSQYHFR